MELYKDNFEAMVYKACSDAHRIMESEQSINRRGIVSFCWLQKVHICKKKKR